MKFSFDLQANLHLLSLKNNLRLIIKKFKSIKAQQKLSSFIKKRCALYFNCIGEYIFAIGYLLKSLIKEVQCI